MFLLTLVVPVVVGLIATIFLNLIANAFDLMNFSQSPALYCIYMLIVNGSFVGLFFVYNRVTKTDFVKASLLKPKFGLLNAILCIIIAPIMLFGSMYLINYLMSLLQGIGYNPDTSLPLPLSNAGWLILNILILAVLPAICEELLYRGVIFNGLRKFGSVGAVLISALFFALAHGSAMQFFYQLILGVVLALIVLKTGSKAVNRNLSVGSAFLRAIPFAIGAGILGFLIVFGLIENVIQISTCDISLGVTIAYQATLGVLVSTLLALVALNKYLSDVKYTKRK